MLRLTQRELALDLLDPTDPADAARQGWRYCWGGYVWQVTDAKLGPLLSGPEFPKPDPTAFNGQGLPESFRHRRRADNTPYTWAGDTGLAIGAGTLAPNPAAGGQGPDSTRLVEPGKWTVMPAADHFIFQTRQTAAGFSYELTRKIELRDRTLISSTQLTNVSDTPLALEWFPHPFWTLTQHRARVRLPAGTTVAENPGFAVAADGTLTFKRPFLTPTDNQFSLLTLPPGRPLALELDHPRLARVTFETSYIPSECPVWANANTISVEPYLALRLAPGETRHWHVQHGFWR
ncbi:MAG: hypothetical protein Q8N18_12320 [Opitutaceae bacterium]|nr:hypothetical protein [Opitutaceae bacterium]